MTLMTLQNTGVTIDGLSIIIDIGKFGKQWGNGNNG
jgi:hypothetical protein